jgi:hypothetical protein
VEVQENPHTVGYARADTITLGEVQPEDWVSFRPLERLPGGFMMTKPTADGSVCAFCEVWTNPFGWEVRLLIGGHGNPVTTVARSSSEMLQTVDQWRAVLQGRGWI